MYPLTERCGSVDSGMGGSVMGMSVGRSTAAMGPGKPEAMTQGCVRVHVCPCTTAV